MQRADDFAKRREHLASLSEQDLEKRFWELANSIMEPLVEMAKSHTSPSTERSVLLRMGFSSLEASRLVKRVEELGLLGRGAGHVLWQLSKMNACSIVEAGEVLMTDAGSEQARAYFLQGGAK